MIPLVTLQKTELSAAINELPGDLVSLSRRRLYAFTLCLGATLQQPIFPINYNYFVKQKEKVALQTACAVFLVT